MTWLDTLAFKLRESKISCNDTAIVTHDLSHSSSQKHIRANSDDSLYLHRQISGVWLLLLPLKDGLTTVRAASCLYLLKLFEEWLSLNVLFARYWHILFLTLLAWSLKHSIKVLANTLWNVILPKWQYKSHITIRQSNLWRIHLFTKLHVRGCYIHKYVTVCTYDWIISSFYVHV